MVHETKVHEIKAVLYKIRKMYLPKYVLFGFRYFLFLKCSLNDKFLLVQKTFL